MKVIFITREDSSMPAVRVRCRDFSRRLQRAGINTEVFSYADIFGAKSGRDERKMGAGEKIRYNFQAYQRLSLEKNILFLQRFNYHSFAPFFLRIFKNYKLVFDLDDWEARENIKYYFNKIPSSKAEIMMRIIANKSHLCIGASKFLVEFLEKYNKNVIYLPTAVNTDFFKPEDEKKKRDNLVVSWIGTIHRRDNVENIRFLIDCFQGLPSFNKPLTLEIAGDGIYIEEIKELVEKSANPQIFLKNWISPEDMPDYLNNVDIGIMPLIQKTKFNMAKSPTKIFEYMAMSKPVIASNIGEAASIINDGENGFLANNKDDFINRLKILIEDKNLRQRMGENARKRVKKYYCLNNVSQTLLENIQAL